MSAPNPTEAKLLKQFRERVSDVLRDDKHKEDSYLIRWIRARDLDLDKAESLLRDSLKWREENKVDSVLEMKLDPFFEKEYPISFKGKDKHGQPVFYIPIGTWDLRKVANEGKTEEFKTYISYMFETVEHEIRESNKDRDPELFPITQFTALVDWGGYSYMQLANVKAVQKILQIAGVFEGHYVEILFRCYFVNCPSFFGILLAMLKPILAPKTLSKITCHGHERKEWEQALEENIDDGQIAKILDSI